MTNYSCGTHKNNFDINCVACESSRDFQSMQEQIKSLHRLLAESEMQLNELRKDMGLDREIALLRRFNEGREVFRERCKLAEEENRQLRNALLHIVGMAGNPDPAEACRLIIDRAKEVLYQ